MRPHRGCYEKENPPSLGAYNNTFVKGIVKNLFSKFQDQREVLDFSSFGDELALKTSWDPLVRKGPSLCTHKLQKSHPLSGDSLRFKVTFAAILCSAVGILVGLGTLFFASIPSGDPLAIFGSLVVVGVGFWVWWCMQRGESVFDRSSRSLAIGGMTYNLDQVCAIQLIREYVRNRDSQYYSYELNLVCADGKRINIVDHNSLRTIRKDAVVLADYLSIPVWDAIDFRIPEQAAH